jgi:hypothetical protein
MCASGSAAAVACPACRMIFLKGRELADYLGMTVETLRRVYGHQDPNYLSDARDAIVRKPNSTERLNATKREQTPSGVAKLHRNH